MKKLINLCIALFIFFNLSAQSNLENKFSMPLKDVFDVMTKRYNVKIAIPSDMKTVVDTTNISYALYRFEPDFKTTLNNILKTIDLDYAINSDGSYKIKRFEHSRITLDKGVKRLAYIYDKYNDLDQWEARHAELKKCIYASLGIDQMVKNLKLTYTSTAKRKMDGYTVENFSLETLPGVYATGSVYRPTKGSKKMPLILNPNGHFAKGRYGVDMQKRCATFARMGAIAVNCDLFAWGESLLAFNSADHKNSIAQQMQILNQIAILNYFCAQPDVDLERVGITGASGGGSQTMVVTAIDDRIKASAPVVMVSCYFNGGCGCESGMPIHLCGDGTNNVEIAAMAAPRPTLIVSDGKDWTDNVPLHEFPFIKRTYGFYGKEANVANVHLPEEGHDYGFSKRIAVYDFMAKTFSLNSDSVKSKSGEYDESKVTIESEDELKTFGVNGEIFPRDAVRGLESLKETIEQITKNLQ